MALQYVEDITLKIHKTDVGKIKGETRILQVSDSFKQARWLICQKSNRVVRINADLCIREEEERQPKNCCNPEHWLMPAKNT